MALYNLDISKCSPKEGESISATTRYFTFRTNGDETYNVSIDKMYSKPTEITYDPSYAYKNYWTVAGTSIFSYAQGNCYPDDTDITLDIGGFGCNWLSGYSIGYRISTYGYPFTMYATSNYYLELRNVNSEARRNLLSSLHSGDLVAVYPNGSWIGSSSTEYFYIHRYGERTTNNPRFGFSQWDRGMALEGANLGSLNVDWHAFDIGTTWIVRRVVRTPVIQLNYVLDSSIIYMDTIYTTDDASVWPSQTLQSAYEKYFCSNSAIKLSFNIGTGRTLIYKYKFDFYSSINSADDDYVEQGSWIYNTEPRLLLTNKMNGDKVCFKLTAVDTNNFEFVTYNGSTNRGILEIDFSYENKAPDLGITPVATYDKCNGCDVISWQNAMPIYGGVYPVNVNTHEYVGYDTVQDFAGISGNEALSLTKNYILTYPRWDSYHSPGGWIVYNQSSAPTFLWQPDANGFNGSVISYTDGVSTIEVYIAGGRIKRKFTTTDKSISGNGTVIDDGAFTLEPSVVYLVGITKERAIFDVYRRLNVTHNKLDFDLSDGNNIL